MTARTIKKAIENLDKYTNITSKDWRGTMCGVLEKYDKALEMAHGDTAKAENIFVNMIYAKNEHTINNYLSTIRRCHPAYIKEEPKAEEPKAAPTIEEYMEIEPSTAKIVSINATPETIDEILNAIKALEVAVAKLVKEESE